MKGSDKVSRVKSVKASEPVTRSRPALTPEGRDNQMMSLAINLAEEQLRNGTASSQVITHYLKMAANKEKEKLEREKLELEKELLKAKTEALASTKRSEELFDKAISALKEYKGIGGNSNEY